MYKCLHLTSFMDSAVCIGYLDTEMNQKQQVLSNIGKRIVFIRWKAYHPGKVSMNTKPDRIVHLKRVVVTGMGVMTCLGVGKDLVWNRILNGDCGLTSLKGKGYEKIPCKVAGFIPRGDKPGELRLENYVSASEQRTMSEGSAYALVATEEALKDARWRPETDKDKESTGVSIGMGPAGAKDLMDTAVAVHERGYSRVSPYFVPKVLINMAAGNVSIKYGLQGPNHAASTACTTGLHAIGDAFRFIQLGHADVMVAGSTEESPFPLSVASFSKMRALSTKFNNTPSKASRPFDKNRDGLVMSEGSGIVILEELEHAQERKATIYAEILGYGLSGDANHITNPLESGSGVCKCMMAALKDANVSKEEIGYINAHATSTPLGDIAESKAIWKLFGETNSQVLVSSTKGGTGHLLAAAGSVEAIFTIMACHTGNIPPTVNLYEPDTGFPLNYIAHKSVDWPTTSTRRIALTNSFGFGGTNSSLCIGSFHVH